VSQLFDRSGENAFLAEGAGGIRLGGRERVGGAPPRAMRLGGGARFAAETAKGIEDLAMSLGIEQAALVELPVDLDQRVADAA